MKFLPIHVSTLSHCLLLLLVIIILRNYISSLRGELFYVISNHSCLDNLKRYESHCKTEIPLHWFRLHQWYCRALNLPEHTPSVDFSLALLSAFGSAFVLIQLFLCFSTLHWGRAQLLCLMLLQNILKYFVVFFFLLYLILLACIDSSVLESWFYSSQYLTQCLGQMVERELVLWNFREIFTLCHAMDAVWDRH